jgi:hypothetical protein
MSVHRRNQSAAGFGRENIPSADLCCVTFYKCRIDRVGQCELGEVAGIFLFLVVLAESIWECAEFSLEYNINQNKCARTSLCQDRLRLDLAQSSLVRDGTQELVVHKNNLYKGH